MRHDGIVIDHRNERRGDRNEEYTIGLDLVCFDEKHKEISKRMLRRNQMREYFAQIEPCRVAMEACVGAHYWGRELKKLGHTVKLIAP